MSSVVEILIVIAVLVVLVGSTTWWCRRYAVRFDLSQRSPYATT